MKKLEHDLLTSTYTEVYHEDEGDERFNAPNHFFVVKSGSDPKDIEHRHIYSGGLLSGIHFQEGPIKEESINGVYNEDLIAMVITRLEHFQKSEFACRDNAIAITKLEEAMLWMRKRTMAREKRGVVGTHTK